MRNACNSYFALLYLEGTLGGSVYGVAFSPYALPAEYAGNALQTYTENFFLSFFSTITFFRRA